MPYRTFVDSEGTEWQVWDIIPRLSERRGTDSDRRISITPIEFFDRRNESRRLTSTRRAVLSGSYAQGWLCFDSGDQTRRLTPIPHDWTMCSEERIESYIARAERASGTHRIISDFVDVEPLAVAG